MRSVYSMQKALPESSHQILIIMCRCLQCTSEEAGVPLTRTHLGHQQVFINHYSPDTPSGMGVEHRAGQTSSLRPGILRGERLVELLISQLII